MWLAAELAFPPALPFFLACIALLVAWPASAASAQQAARGPALALSVFRACSTCLWSLQLHWKKLREGSYRGHGYEVYKGTFRTPCFGRIYDALPEESRRAARKGGRVGGRAGGRG